MILHLGVYDIPYAQRPSAPKKVAKARRNAKPKPTKVASGHQTTGDVATWLENKYGVMQAFADLHMPEIGDMLAESLKGSLESVLMGAPPPNNPFASAESGIEQSFRKFIESEGLNGLVAGVPTAAALRGVNHRLARPNAKGNPSRPSFVDTGLYLANFRAEVD